MTECPSCGAAPPAEAAFCPQCGARLDAGATARAEVPPHETSAGPLSVSRAMPTYFGLTPPTLLFGLAAATLATGGALALSGYWIAALLCVGVALLLFAAFVEVGRRKPDAAVVRRTVAAVDTVRTRAGYAAQSLVARSAAAREIRVRRAQLFALGLDRDRLLRDLGAAVYEDDDARRQAAEQQLAALDEEAQRLEAEIAAVAEHARERVAAVQATEVLRRDD